MAEKKGRFYCKVHRIWFYWTQDNKGKCTICHAPAVKKEAVKK